VSDGANEVSQIAFSSDGGATWAAQTPLAWSLNDTITDMNCTNSLDCLVSATSDADTLVLEVTRDGAQTWSTRLTPSKWTSLTSLSCYKMRCVALADTDSKSLVVRTVNFARDFRTLSLSDQANALSCTSFDRCVVVGETGPDNPWFATVDNLQFSRATLKYVPSPLVDVACGTKVCVAIGVTTVLTYRP
jgi:hypothetical protein